MAAILYNVDFYAWSQHQVKLLRAEAFEEVDWNNLIEEIDNLSRSEKSEVENRLIILIMHLLKWQYQPELQSRSWIATINVQRDDLERLLRRSPSLRTWLTEIVTDIYPSAVKRAVAETGLRKAAFPAECPYSTEQIMDEEFWPQS